jgi:hypothetical protein
LGKKINYSTFSKKNMEKSYFSKKKSRFRLDSQEYGWTIYGCVSNDTGDGIKSCAPC